MKHSLSLLAVKYIISMEYIMSMALLLQLFCMYYDSTMIQYSNVHLPYMISGLVL